jgi:GTP-binding protein
MILATYHSSSVSLEGLPNDPRPHVAMIGRSNVGKSSLINHLTQRKDLARVSSKPGRTQTINLYEINKKFFLADLPGYGYAQKSLAQRALFAEMIRTYLREKKELKLILLIIDARIPLTELDADMLEWLQGAKIPFVLVTNKMDELSRNEVTTLNQNLDEKYPGIKRVEHSQESEKNRKEIWTLIEGALKA